MTTFGTLCVLLAFLLLPFHAAANKRGLPYNSVSNIQNFNAAGSQVAWAYNWASIMNPGFPTYLEFIPMLFNNAPGTFATVRFVASRDAYPPFPTLVSRRYSMLLM